MKEQAVNPPANNVDAHVAQALSVYQAGDLGKAEMLVKTLTQDAYSLNFLGVIYGQQGKFTESIQTLEKAISLNPDYFEAYTNLGLAFYSMKRYTEALACYDKAIALNPAFAKVHNHRGFALYALKKPAEALASHEKAIALNPGYAEAYTSRGFLLSEFKRYAEALESCKKAIALNPSFAKAYNSLGTVLKALRRNSEALASYDKALALDPNNAEAHNDCGAILYDTGKYDEAMQHYAKALALRPGLSEAYNNKAVLLCFLRQYDEAIVNYEKAIALNPEYSEAYNNLGIILTILKQYDAAEANFDRAIKLKRDYGDAYLNKAMLKLLLGKYEEGWKLYEWRWENAILKEYYGGRNFGKPLWLGKESLKGKTILLHAEQGFGDTLQFCRYVPMVAALGAKVIFEVPPSVAALASTLKGNPLIVTEGSPLPSYDFHCPLMSLPLAFNTKVETIPSELCYLSAQPEYVEKWKPILDDKLGKEKLRVGLCWAGGVRPDNPNAMKIDAVRSLTFSQIKPLLDCQNVQFVSLQLGSPKDQLDDKRVLDISSDLKDWSDTAAVISLLDLVITVDTSVCHMVGALGKKFWLLNRSDTCWRWFLDKEVSPWYPTGRIFRQSTAGDWTSVIEKVKDELARLK